MQPSQLITPEELAALGRLKNALCSILEATELFILRLDGAEDDSLRSKVCDRLRCVLQDSLTPALRDLDSIVREAEGGGTA